MVTLVIPPQEVITRDNVPVRVNAVAYFQVVDPSASIVKVADFSLATSQISQTTLRSVLGQHMLDELLSERDKINQILQRIIDEQTEPWGIKVNVVEVKRRRDPRRHAARDGPAGGGGARAPRKGDRRRGRVPGVRQADRRGRGDRPSTRSRSSCATCRRCSRSPGRTRAQRSSRCRSTCCSPSCRRGRTRTAPRSARPAHQPADRRHRAGGAGPRRAAGRDRPRRPASPTRPSARSARATRR